jgi:hypothetical protein
MALPLPKNVTAKPRVETYETFSREDLRGDAVGDSADIRRVASLPRRPRPSDEFLLEFSDFLKWQLGRKDVTRATCRCAEFPNKGRMTPTGFDVHCDELLPTQAWALYEAAKYGGILGPIGVGHGKTLLDMLVSMVLTKARTVVLLLPSPLKKQFLEVDWHYYSQHWNLPNLATGKTFYDNRPFLHVLSFPELSGAKNTELLDKLNPDVVIVDEAHNLRNVTAARTKRFNRFMDGAKERGAKLFCWSGTLTDSSIEDWSTLSEYALGDGSPAPLHWPAVQEWAAALDPGPSRNPTGHLYKLGVTNEAPIETYGKWVNDTAGVISSGDKASCQASLLINERVVTVPADLQEYIKRFDEKAKQDAWQRPDGDEIVDALSAAACARQLACGFFYRWRWPIVNGEPQRIEVIEAWKAARKLWRSELRAKVQMGGAHMDSPLLVTKAAIRWAKGYVHVFHDEEGKEVKRVEYPPHTKKGPLPTWDSKHWAEWERLRETAVPENEAVWVSDFLVEDALAWLAEGPGILWYEFNAFAQRLAEKGADAALTIAGPGDSGTNMVLALKGNERVVASIRAHGTGRNLQQFARNLVANPPSGGGAWEQLLGRTHRQGQKANEVHFQVYVHTEAFMNAVRSARELSHFIQGTFGATQRLASVASWGFDL